VLRVRAPPFFEEWARQASSSCSIVFSENKAYGLSDFGISQTFFSKIRQVNLSLQRKQLRIFYQRENLNFQVKIRVLENLFLPPGG
jgi:hypothetical protein